MDVVEVAQRALQLPENLHETAPSPGLSEQVPEQFGRVSGLLGFNPQPMPGFGFQLAQPPAAGLDPLGAAGEGRCRQSPRARPLVIDPCRRRRSLARVPQESPPALRSDGLGSPLVGARPGLGQGPAEGGGPGRLRRVFALLDGPALGEDIQVAGFVQFARHPFQLGPGRLVLRGRDLAEDGKRRPPAAQGHPHLMQRLGGPRLLQSGFVGLQIFDAGSLDHDQGATGGNIPVERDFRLLVRRRLSEGSVHGGHSRASQIALSAGEVGRKRPRILPGARRWRIRRPGCR